MAITRFTASRVGPTTWVLSFESDDPDATFYVYRDGVLYATTPAGGLTVDVLPGEAPVFEVFDDPAGVPADAYPPYAVLAWYAQPAGAVAADHYDVQQYDGAAWATIDAVDETGAGYYAWQSGELDDATTYAFRVLPVGADGNEGTPAAFTVLVVRVPVPPAVSMAYSAGTGRVTISAA